MATRKAATNRPWPVNMARAPMASASWPRGQCHQRHRAEAEHVDAHDPSVELRAGGFHGEGAVDGLVGSEGEAEDEGRGEGAAEAEDLRTCREGDEAGAADDAGGPLEERLPVEFGE
ncbi:hypothetical protein O0235_00790 [Tepidiforma flava]|uniref:Uncharacterized protein n=1 Tax=Tepidiforma flava TaxID=3004094 RepID=A0ABY7M6M5_9CHLR|nr:hypothetical protein [Tepidiforma flava]WBL36187.1 hypothetical protein O0235_00790 [Tepidiforma flava]